MKIHSPKDWKPGDNDKYFFRRSSGLPLGYFDGSWLHRHTRGRKTLLIMAFAILLVWALL